MGPDGQYVQDVFSSVLVDGNISRIGHLPDRFSLQLAGRLAAGRVRPQRKWLESLVNNIINQEAQKANQLPSGKIAFEKMKATVMITLTRGSSS